jgi:hypothetical protein
MEWIIHILRSDVSHFRAPWEDDQYHSDEYEWDLECCSQLSEKPWNLTVSLS